MCVVVTCYGSPLESVFNRCKKKAEREGGRGREEEGDGSGCNPSPALVKEKAKRARPCSLRFYWDVIFLSLQAAKLLTDCTYSTRQTRQRAPFWPDASAIRVLPSARQSAVGRQPSTRLAVLEKKERHSFDSAIADHPRDKEAGPNTAVAAKGGELVEQRAWTCRGAISDA